MKIFLGLIIDTSHEGQGNVVHSHMAMHPEDCFHVDIWTNHPDNPSEGIPLIQGEFRKWGHLKELIRKEHPHLMVIGEYKKIDAIKVLDFMVNNDFKEASLF